MGVVGVDDARHQPLHDRGKMLKLKNGLLAVLLAVSAAGGAVGEAHAVTVQPKTHKVSCGKRTDWFRMWTATHGSPVCYTSAGKVTYGHKPPKNTWTTYGICSGNHKANVEIYFTDGRGNWYYEPIYLKKKQCEDFSTDPNYGRAVEVAGFTLH